MEDFSDMQNESFAIIEKDGKRWKTLAETKGLNNARDRYNYYNKKTRNEMRLVTLNELRTLKKLSEAKQLNEAPMNAKSMYAGLVSNLNTMFSCSVTDEGFLKCEDDDGNFIEVAFIEDTDPIELAMRVNFKDGTDFITAVFLGEVNAYEDALFDEKEKENLSEEVDNALEEIDQENIEKAIEETNEMCMMKLPVTPKAKDVLNALYYTTKYYTDEDLMNNLDPFIDELNKRGVKFEEEQINSVRDDLNHGIDFETSVCDAFKITKNESGTVADLGTAPILPVGSSLFPNADELEELNESVDDRVKEFESLMETGIEAVQNGDNTAEDWFNDAKFVLGEITDKDTKDRLQKQYSKYLGKVSESKETLKGVVDDLIKATNKLDTPAVKLEKEFTTEPKKDIKVTDGTPIAKFKPMETMIPIIDQDIMNNAIIAASSAVTNPKPEIFVKLQETFKNIDKKTVETLINESDIGGLAKYLYESAINKNEDTFSDPQLNIVDNNINKTTDVSGNDPETPKLADDINPAPTEVEGFPKDKSEIENTSNTNTTDDQLAKDTGTEDIPTK